MHQKHELLELPKFVLSQREKSIEHFVGTSTAGQENDRHAIIFDGDDVLRSLEWNYVLLIVSSVSF